MRGQINGRGNALGVRERAHAIRLCQTACKGWSEVQTGVDCHTAVDVVLDVSPDHCCFGAFLSAQVPGEAVKLVVGKSSLKVGKPPPLHVHMPAHGRICLISTMESRQTPYELLCPNHVMSTTCHLSHLSFPFSVALRRQAACGGCSPRRSAFRLCKGE